MPDGVNIFDLTGKVAVITGGGGELGGAISCGLARAGAHIAVTNVTLDKAAYVAEQMRETCGHAVGYQLDITKDGAIDEFTEEVYKEFGKVDILVNCVGGNMKEATTSDEKNFFDLDFDSIRKVMDLNLMSGIIRPCQAVGKRMVAEGNSGSIINISSMAASRPLTRIIGYSAAKAAVDNFTKWFAVHLALELKSKVRVNAIAPGFFLTPQNQFLLTNDRTGELTKRGQQIIDHTPMGDFGVAGDLVSTALWLASDASRFVTGTIVAVDGGFSAYAGV